MKEYKIIRAKSGATAKKIRQKAEEKFNKLAAEGWELKVSSSLGYIFEREKP